jgi:hypothetical protein
MMKKFLLSLTLTAAVALTAVAQEKKVCPMGCETKCDKKEMKNADAKKKTSDKKVAKAKADAKSVAQKG